ncbi:Crp/Fnr family transcriptional regulator [Croceicoccus sp. Ery15]|uniref:Crp/Fnr family transcriptional regulator n=1 Tax=Croceicoccus sp. Ery15 TaxID=1703338 RepID=UPI001E467180|nr:Crp/Fnr family transcriptional regulator [Croceicoccus sp. Ery15]
MNGSQSAFFRQERDFRTSDADIATALANLARRLALFGAELDLSVLHPAVDRIGVIQRDQPIWADRNHNDRIFALESGFAFAFSLYPDGRRHIGDIFAPGAICNWSSVWGGMLVENVTFKARSRVIVFDRERLSDIVADNRSLREAIERHEMARCHRRQQRCRGLISLPATDRLALALLDIQDELATGGEAEEWIGLPLTLRELGDFTGLTDVHVSRTLKKLQDTGFIEKRGKRLRLNAQPKMRAALDYQQFYLG